MAWAGRPLWAQHPCPSSFLRSVTFQIGVFFTPPHVLRKKTASLTLFTFPKMMEAVVEEAGSTYSPAHPLQHCTNWWSGCAPCISSRIDPNTVIQDGPLDQKPGAKTNTFLSNQQLGTQWLGYTGQSLSSSGEEEPPILLLWALIPLKFLMLWLLWKTVKWCWLPTTAYFLRTPHIRNTTNNFFLIHNNF